MDDKRIAYFPFHAINEYMLPEFRLDVIGSVLRGMDSLSGARRSTLNNMIKRYISVPGFRNSAAAPLGVKIRSAVSPFERHADFAAAVLQAWCELHPDLGARTHTMLQTRSFTDVLPLEADRSKLPGFQTNWPKIETYEALDQAFYDANSGFEAESNDIRLMVVWLVNRLPYDLFDDEEADADASE
jgi:hypothetical protein